MPHVSYIKSEIFDGQPIDVKIYTPSTTSNDILLVHHGDSRSTYDSGSERLADVERFSVFSPIFPESSYDTNEYQLGGIVDDLERVQPEDEWTVRLEEPIVDWAREQVGGDGGVYLFGFSAGGQYLSRVAAYEPPEGVTRFIVSSPSTWVLPSLTEKAPYGFDGLGTDAEEEAALKAYLALPMTIYLGSEDNDPNDPALSTNSAAMRQGATRLERGINTFNMGHDVAEANGWAFNWTLVIADGVGHGGSSMLRAPEMIEALYPADAVDLPANGVPYDLALVGSSIEETAAAGAVIGQLSAFDPEGDTLVFSVTGDARFSVRGSDLVVSPGADLSGDGDRPVRLTIGVSDGHGGMAEAPVTITIVDSVGGDDTLVGGSGADILGGGAGDDTYVVNNTGDEVVENAGDGVDTVLVSVSKYTLAANIENLTVTGSRADATGNALANVMVGGIGGDTLNGQGGADTLIGGKGSDLLIGGAGADTIDVGGPDDNVRDRVRFGAVDDFGDHVTHFDVNGTADQVKFSGALNSAWDDLGRKDDFVFASGNGKSGTVSANVSTTYEALYLSGAHREGVANDHLNDAFAVAAAFDAEFVISAKHGADALLVVNDTDGEDFSIWQWVQNGSGEITADELRLIGIFTANGTVATSSFDFT